MLLPYEYFKPGQKAQPCLIGIDIYMLYSPRLFVSYSQVNGGIIIDKVETTTTMMMMIL